MSSDILKLLNDARFSSFALKCDREFAKTAQEKKCPHCGSILHSASYPRKITHGCQFNEADNRFFGLCCSKEGCRRRVRPFSIRFAGNGHYSPQFLLLATLLIEAAEGKRASKKRIKQVATELSISYWTIKRWLRLWRVVQGGTQWWRDLLCGFGLNGQSLVEIWQSLEKARGLHDAFEFLLKKTATLWFEVKINGDPKESAEFAPQSS